MWGLEAIGGDSGAEPKEGSLLTITPRQIFGTYDVTATHGSVPWRYCPMCGTAWTPTKGEEVPRCASCGYRAFRNPSPAVSVLVVHGSRFVLCRRRVRAFKGGTWCLPSGYIDYGEDFLTAARREVREETGLETTVTAILSVASNFFTPTLHSLVVVLLAEPTSPNSEPVGGDDIDLAAWFDDPEHLPEMAFEADAHIIRRYFTTRVAGAPVDTRYAGDHERS